MHTHISMPGLLICAELLILQLNLCVQQSIKLMALLCESPVILLSIVLWGCAAICNALTNATKNRNICIKSPIWQHGHFIHEATDTMQESHSI